MLTTIIERGDSGTRAMSHTLSASGVWMGEPLNGSGDLQALPAVSKLGEAIAFLQNIEYEYACCWRGNRVRVTLGWSYPVGCCIPCFL